MVATGGGLHVAAYYIEHHSELGAAGTMLTVAIPVAVAIAGIFGLYAYLTQRDRRVPLAADRRLGGGARAVLSRSRARGWRCTGACSSSPLTPWVTVVGYEVRGHEHNARVLQSLQ